MSKYADRAEALFRSGLNCAQAVLGAYAEEYGLDEETALRLASTLGGGIGHTGQICGAALGAVIAMGLAKGSATGTDAEAKRAQSERAKRLVEAFREEFGGTSCKELYEMGNRELCTTFVRHAAELVQQERRNRP